MLGTLHSLVARSELGSRVQGEAVVVEGVVNVLQQVLQGSLHISTETHGLATEHTMLLRTLYCCVQS